MTTQMRLARKTSPDKSGRNGCHAICLPAIDAATAVVIADVNRWLEQKSVDEPTRLNVQIVLAEALNNIVEHGYSDIPLGAMALCVELQSQNIRLTLTDWGKPYPEETLPVARRPDPMSLAEGGYGWSLIYSLCRDLEYRRQGGANILSLAVRAAPFV